MLESNLKLINNDIHVLIKDAQELFKTAAGLTGEKADEMRQRASRMLDLALAQAQGAQKSAIVAGREAVKSADGFVKKRPWQVMAAAAGLGVLTGVIVGRK